MRHFFEISKSGNIRLLIRSGEATINECEDAWEKIVEKNNHHADNNQLDNYKNLVKQYNMALNELNAVVSTIMCLFFVVDEEQIKFLRSKGYKINTSSGSAFDTSLAVALHESGKINSKIKSKLKQIERFSQKAMEAQEGQGNISVDDLISSLSIEVGFQIPDTVTLSQYNAYASRIKKRNELKEHSPKKHNARA